MAAKKGIREKFIELMYVLLYVMFMMASQNVVDDIGDKLLKVDEFKRNIEISCSDIDSIVEKAKNNIRLFNNSANIKKNFENVVNIFKIWEKYKIDNEEEIIKMIDEAGGYKEDNNLKSPDNKDVVLNFINNGNFTNIKKRVNDIIDKINEYDFLKKDDIFVKINSELNNFLVSDIANQGDNITEKNENIFSGKRLIDVLYYLYYKELNISSYIRIILDKMFNNIVLDHPNFDKFDLIVVPKSNKIIAGNDYEATIFLNAKDYFKIENEEPEIKVDGINIKVKDYIGNFVFPTSRNFNFDENGECKITLNVEYFQKNPFSDKDIILKKNINFTVIRKDEVEGRIDVLNKFYKKCLNKYILKVEDHELKKELEFRFSGGNLISVNKDKSSNEVELVLYPTEDNCYLSVLSNSREINKFNFIAIDTPMPTLDILVNYKQIVDGVEFDAKDLQNIFIDVINDENFEISYPLDSTNSIKYWYIEIKDHDKRTIKTIEVRDSNSYEFSISDMEFLNNKKCAYLYIRVKDIFREHRDVEGGEVKDSIALLSPFEIFGKQIKILHKEEGINV